MTVQQQMTVNREYKSHMFIMVFQDKGKLLELYNAVSGRHYEEVSLELKVDILNINIGHNKELLEACRTLGEYAEYVSRVRRYAKEMPIGEAVERTIEECIRENILREFLEKNRAEANAVSIYEYNEEEHMRMEREDAFADGLQEGVRRERINTERERLRAEEEKRRAEEEKLRADQAEAEVLRLKKELAEISRKQMI